MELVKNYFEYVHNPTQALQKLIETPSFRQACWGYFASTLSWVVFFNIGDEIGIPVFLLKLLIVFVAELTLGAFIAAFSGLFLSFRAKNISPAQLFVLIGSSGFIKGLLIAFALISAMWPQAELWMLAPAALVLVFMLQLGYLTFSLRRVGNIPLSLGLLSWLFGIVPVGMSFSLLGVFVVWMVLLI